MGGCGRSQWRFPLGESHGRAWCAGWQPSARPATRKPVPVAGRPIPFQPAGGLVLAGAGPACRSASWNSMTLDQLLPGQHARVAAIHGDETFDLIDLPGTYSLAPRSPDEMLAVEIILGQPPADSRPDVVVAIVDASNLDRNLYLVTQILESGVPVVVALNMMDVAAKQ